MLEPKSYAQFFGNSMTPAIISSIVEALSKHGLEYVTYLTIIMGPSCA